MADDTGADSILNFRSDIASKVSERLKELDNIKASLAGLLQQEAAASNVQSNGGEPRNASNDLGAPSHSFSTPVAFNNYSAVSPAAAPPSHQSPLAQAPPSHQSPLAQATPQTQASPSNFVTHNQTYGDSSPKVLASLIGRQRQLEANEKPVHHGYPLRRAQPAVDDSANGNTAPEEPTSQTPAATLSPKTRGDRVIFDKITEKVMGKSAHLRNVFRQFDNDRDGLLTYDELRSGLREMNVLLSPREGHRICQLMDEKGKGVIEFEDFASTLSNPDKFAPKSPFDRPSLLSQMVTQDYVEPPSRNVQPNPDSPLGSVALLAPFGQQKPVVRESSPLPPVADREDIALRRKVVDRVFPDQNRAVQVFSRLDKKGDGKISYSQLEKGLWELGVHLSKDEHVKLLKYADPNETGAVDFRDFTKKFTPIGGVAAYQPTSAPPVKETPRKRTSPAVAAATGSSRILETVKAKIEAKSRNFRKVFRSFDENHDGVLSMDEVTDGLFGIGISLTNDERKELGRHLDPEDKEEITFADFAHVMAPRELGTHRNLMTSNPQSNPTDSVFGRKQHRSETQFSRNPGASPNMSQIMSPEPTPRHALSRSGEAPALQSFTPSGQQQELMSPIAHNTPQQPVVRSPSTPAPSGTARVLRLKGGSPLPNSAQAYMARDQPTRPSSAIATQRKADNLAGSGDILGWQ